MLAEQFDGMLAVDTQNLGGDLSTQSVAMAWLKYLGDAKQMRFIDGNDQ
ncbi:Uncharacterised protein [Raoultella planticola]|uniref:Uncharacterized protein n=1 Tax=Raoultella planticola TaxID=575 RepID=A0A485DA28_RAOPL|nr:Uncharacterised protein [Raoultella planticola]